MDPYSSLPYLLVTLAGTPTSTTPTSTSGTPTSSTPSSSAPNSATSSSGTPSSLTPSTPTPSSLTLTPTSWVCDVDGTRSSALVVAGDAVVCSVSDVLFDGGYKAIVISGTDL